MSTTRLTLPRVNQRGQYIPPPCDLGQAPAPARIVEGGIPSEALIAQVLVPITCRFTAKRRSTPAKVSSSTVSPWLTGRGAAPGTCVRCMTMSSNG